MVTRYRDKNTGKRYVKCGDNYFEAIDASDLDLVEVDNENYRYLLDTRVHNNFKIQQLLTREWQLKETLYVPVGDKVVAFIVEHIRHTDCTDDVFFVAKDIVGYSNIDNMNKFLDDFTNEMPQELVDAMVPIEHYAEVEGEITRFKRKVNLLSCANFKDVDYCTGKDDIPFDGLQTQAERCKNDKDGETHSYWTCSPFLGNSTHFMFVPRYGSTGYHSFASSVLGVVPCFSIRIYNGEAF